MGNKTLNDRVLDLEQIVSEMKKALDSLVEKSIKYDKVIETKAAAKKRMMKMRAAKQRKAYEERKKAEGFVIKKPPRKDSKRKNVFIKEQIE